MNILAGVDEAGLGPILGPLVVAGVAMQGNQGTDPWQALQALVARERHVKGKVRVADSKKVNSGPHGLLRLEETVLSFWTAWRGQLPETLEQWLSDLQPDLQPLRRCAWYQDLAVPLPLCADRNRILLNGELLARSLAASDLSILQMAVRPVEVEEWNRLIAATDNKSRAHFHAYGEVIAQLVHALPLATTAVAHLVADRCGGRMHYGTDLRRLFPGSPLTVLHEQPATSAYRLQQQNCALTVTFSEKGEDRAFPTALASCCAKYCRELLMHCLNAWFSKQVPGLVATAGYFVDGHRWLNDVLPHLGALQVSTERLVRVR